MNSETAAAVRVQNAQILGVPKITLPEIEYCLRRLWTLLDATQPELFLRKAPFSRRSATMCLYWPSLKASKMALSTACIFRVAFNS